MKARILDVEALKAISPAALVAFARQQGWTLLDAYGEHADVYTAEGRPEIILPRTDRLGDYASLVSRLLGIFAEARAQDEPDIYRDLIGADCDVIRVRSFTDLDGGSIPLDAGVRLVTHARDMLLAAACSARVPQAVHRAGANKAAAEYMEKVRLGQTENGSFVVTLLAPMPPRLEASPEGQNHGGPHDPRERMVSLHLLGALAAAREAAEKALSMGMRAFENAVAAGVSANLCEAVSGLVEDAERIDISITWARTRPVAEGRRTVSFSRSDAGILREAARTFRLQQPRPDISLYGTVQRLKREHEELDGHVTLKTVFDDHEQTVRAVLDRASYECALRAHQEKRQIVASGDLKRVGQRWWLENARLAALPRMDAAEEEGDAAPSENAA